ncbi:PREDICTED: uncharacterized protein LOC108662433 [Theobroma cacao]|uniref:Uncharacterized protein LOC108662433 n=1 Tax=Theobroma cacao TaxID=3641 RepID=A0AB32WFG9_THECC|nr:PREDICTED: uncharacterized protein LOC108662433 [Theobroma cacao]
MAQASVGEDDLVIYILNGLAPEFKELSITIRARESAISFEELHDKFIDFETTLKQDDSYPITLCEKPSHTAKICRLNKSSIKELAVNIATASQFHDNKNQVVDSGASHHVTTDLNNLSLYIEYGGPEEIVVGDGFKHGGTISERSE